MKQRMKLLKSDEYITVKSVKTHKNVKEGSVVVVMQNFFIQLLLDATVHL